MKFAYIDFEFNRTNHEKVNLVSCCTEIDSLDNNEESQTVDVWLHKNNYGKSALVELLNSIKDTHVLVAHAVVAEARSFISLGLNPLDFKWIDTFIESRQLNNSNILYTYGWNLVDGQIKYTLPIKRKFRDEDRRDSFNADYDNLKANCPGQEFVRGWIPKNSLAELTYKATKKVRDTEHKEAMRNLIISNPEDFSKEERESILAYGKEDVRYMRHNLKYLVSRMEKSLPDGLFNLEEYYKEAMYRGRYSCHTAIMESHGYPIDIEKTRNFTDKLQSILYSCQKEINRLFPDIKPFVWKKVEGKKRFSLSNLAVKNWIETTPYKDDWDRTEKAQDYSLSLDSFTKFYDFKHDYPTDNFGAQMVRYLKLKQSLAGFVENKDGSFWDFVGPDGRARAYLNHYGSQTSRTQPGAKGFLFLKPAWMRALCVPKEGMSIGGIDYSSQEFLIQAIKSGDKKMVDAYRSGDVYLAFAKDSGLAPADATKTSHKFIRDLCKSTVLGIGFDMSKIGLSIKLTVDSGKEFTQDQAQKLIDLFFESYKNLKKYKYDISNTYLKERYLKLSDGWYLFGDNDNLRSVGNFPIQGAGAAIMRRAVEKAVSRGLKVIFTLHDAIYIEFPTGREDHMLTLNECMVEAFIEEFPQDVESAKSIRTEAFAWSKYYKRDSEMLVKDFPIALSDLYIDERSITDYNKFSIYFHKREEDEL